MNKVELLAPAGDLDSFYAALNNGADAIYLGLNKYNARIKANNFLIDQIRKITQTAHLFGVKIYLTINIILKDDEFESFIEDIFKCIEAKVDGYIIQDLGVATILKNYFPFLVLHASTQMGVHNYQGAKILEDYGFKRVILSRETPISEIKKIKEKTNLEVEYFVHGALCVGFSGNCYMSYILSGHSGNRGECRQYCRKLYEGSNGITQKTGYLLSTYDLCYINKLKELYDAGVNCFKIEGRLRRSGYVGVVTNYYRKIIDQNFRTVNSHEMNELLLAFSRGKFNETGYLHANNYPIINLENQNHTGLKIGKVINVKPFKKELYEIAIESTHLLATGDGLKFYNKNKEITSIGVGNVNKNNNLYLLITKNPLIKKGQDVHLILDNKMEEKYLKNTRKNRLKMTLIAYVGDKLTLNLTCNHISVSFQNDYILPKARNVITSKEEIKRQLSKISDTHFIIEDIEVKCDDVFIPKSILNQIRRDGIKMLEEQIIADFEKNHQDVIKCDTLICNDTSKPLFIMQNGIIIDETFDCRKLSNFSGLIIISPRDFNNPVLEKLILNIVELKKQVALNLPIILFENDRKIIDRILSKYPKLIVIANNIGELDYSRKHQLIAGLGLNINNSFSLKFVYEHGAVNAILGIEVNDQLKKQNNECFNYAYGYNTLMNFAHCPYKVIGSYENCQNCQYNSQLSYQDEQKKHFSVRRLKLAQCYFELLNSHPYENLTANNPIYDLRMLKDSEIDVILNKFKLV